MSKTVKNMLRNGIEQIQPFENAEDFNFVYVSKSSPVEVEKGEIRPSDGGLANAVASAVSDDDSWVFKGDEDLKSLLEGDGELGSDIDYSVSPVWFAEDKETHEEIEDGYYYGVSNEELWPMFHDLRSDDIENVENSEVWSSNPEAWTDYRAADQKLALSALDQADEDSVIWVHDYQNILSNLFIKQIALENEMDNPLMYTHHIPVPGSETFSETTDDQAIFEGLAAPDVVGLHTEQDRENLLDIAEEYGAEVDRRTNSFTYEGLGTTRVEAQPIGPDLDDYAAVETDELGRRRDIIDEEGLDEEDAFILFGMGRKDLTKGYDRLLQAFQEFEARNPEKAENTSVVLRLGDTRSEIDAYQEIQDKITELGEEIDSVNFHDEWLEHEDIVELYRAADMTVLPSYADGENLVGKEAVMADYEGEHPGSVMVGEGAGVAEEFGEDALLVNPASIDSMVEAMETAYEMDQVEREERIDSMYRKAVENDNAAWVERYSDLARELI